VAVIKAIKAKDLQVLQGYAEEGILRSMQGSRCINCKDKKNIISYKHIA